MKTHVRRRGSVKVNPQQASFELKQRVLHALNKLADRDTSQIGVEELEKTAAGLSPEGVAPFLSCVIDTDSGQKSTVRKECIRIMGTLVRLHEGLLCPHLGKMVGSIVKCLKDPDTVVRDACVEVVGVLASKMTSCAGDADGTFVVIAKPLFEAIGEQNRQVQSGSALCLANVIDNAVSPPVSVLSRMLTRITKLLKNPHFMAKPAIIELIRCIIQVGGAPTENALSTAISNIQEALKSSDWMTRKAAAVALSSIVISGGSLMLSIKESCICSLESCRFDKVKPVRDTVLQALQYWKSLSGSNCYERSEVGSSTKENSYGCDYSDLTSASDSGWKSIASKKVVTNSVKRTALASRKTSPNIVQSPQNSKANDWSVEIIVPKAHTLSSALTYADESEDNCFAKAFERTTENATGVQDIEYDCVSMDDKPECSSMSHRASSNFETKCVTDAHDCPEKGALMSPVGMNQYAETEVGCETLTCSEGFRERQSLDSVTSESPHGRRWCCSQTGNILSSIQKQLQDIETKQSNLMDLLQMFMGSTLDSLSVMQSKVFGLETAVDRIAQDVQRKNHSNVASSKVSKSTQSFSSPRLSICTPRPSLDISNRQSSVKSVNNMDILRETFSNSRSSTSDKRDAEMLREPFITRNHVVNGMQQSIGQQVQNTNCQTRKVNGVTSSLACNAINRKCNTETKNSLWKRVKDFLCNGHLDSAFVEVLCSGDDLTLIELLDRTGPVLERLSHETVGEILSTLAVYFLDQRFLRTIIPWLQQVVDLSVTYGPDYLILSGKARREFLSAIEEVASMDFPNPADRRSITQLAMKLRQVWGKFC